MEGEEFKKLIGTSQIHKQRGILMYCFVFFVFLFWLKLERARTLGYIVLFI